MDRLELRLKKSLEERKVNNRGSKWKRNNRSTVRAQSPVNHPSRPRTAEKEFVRNQRNEIPITAFNEQKNKLRLKGRRNMDREDYKQLYEKRTRDYANQRTEQSSIGSRSASIEDLEKTLKKYRRKPYEETEKFERTSKKPLYPLTCRDKTPTPKKKISYSRNRDYEEEEEYVDTTLDRSPVTPNRSYFGYQTSHLVKTRNSPQKDKYERFKQKYEKRAVELNEPYKREYTARGGVHYPTAGPENNGHFHPALTRKYSYGDLSLSFLSRIVNSDLQAKLGTSFDKYLRECKEDLELAFRAQQSLRSRPLMLPQVRLHRDYQSKFIFSINFFLNKFST